MFFYVSKIIWFFLQPSTAMLLLLLAGTLLLWTSWARAGRRIVFLSGALLALTGLSPVGHLLILPLEERFSRYDIDASGAPDGIVILGGAQDMSVSARRRTIAVNEAGERLIETAALARKYPAAKILFTGGSDAVFGDKESEASGAAAILSNLGVDRARLTLEDKSKNTYQNALYSSRLAKPGDGERWLLITSASHMPRAIGSFRQAGFAVEPWPVDYRTRGKEDLLRFFPKPSEGWRRVDAAVREWVGLFAYRVTGRTDNLFPRAH